jgi:hypothetical protein
VWPFVPGAAVIVERHSRVRQPLRRFELLGAAPLVFKGAGLDSNLAQMSAKMAI